MSSFRRYGVAALTVVVAAIAVRLGIWQYHRHESRKAANVMLLAARDLPPLDLSHDVPVAGRRATVRGKFDTRNQVLLRNRVSRQAPGVHVVTLFRTESAAPIWVLRGFVLAANGVNPGPVEPAMTGTVTISGELHQLPVTADGGAPLLSDGDSTWQRFDAAVARARESQAPALLLYLEGGESGPGRLREVEPPVLDNGPHLSYAFQWLAIACASLAFGVLVLRSRRSPAGPEPAPPPRAP